jgi:serine/threonine-protein phosphatase 6 regulatory subunit 3
MHSNLNREVYRYGVFDNEDAEEGHGAMERDEEDVFFDDESAEVVISSLRLGDDQDSGRESMFAANSNWFAFQEDYSRSKEDSNPTFLISAPPLHNDDGLAANVVSPPNSSGDSSSDDEVVLGEDEDLIDTATSARGNLSKIQPLANGPEEGAASHSSEDKELSSKLEKVDLSDNLSLFRQQEEEVAGENMPDWMLGLRETAPGLEGTSGRDAFGDTNPFDVHFPDPAEPAGEAPALPGDESNTDAVLSPPTVLPAEFVRELVPAEGHMINPMTGEEIAGVEPDGTIRAMEKMLKEGVVGEAVPMFTNEHEHEHENDVHAKEIPSGDSDFNDRNYWRSDYSQSVDEEEHL